MRWPVTPRDLREGAVAAVAALTTMAAVSLAGLLLLGADPSNGLAGLTAATVALAVGGSVQVEALSAGAVPVSVQGVLEVMPLGVSLAGAAVLGAMLARRGRTRFLSRSGAAVAILGACLVAMTRLTRSTMGLRPPEAVSTAVTDSITSSCPTGRFGGGWTASTADRLAVVDVGFSVTTGPTLVAALAWVAAVVSVCWLALRYRTVARACPSTPSSTAPLIRAGKVAEKKSSGRT